MLYWSNRDLVLRRRNISAGRLTADYVASRRHLPRHRRTYLSQRAFAGAPTWIRRRFSRGWLAAADCTEPVSVRGVCPRRFCRAADGMQPDAPATLPGAVALRAGTAPLRTGSAYESGSLQADRSGSAHRRSAPAAVGVGSDREPAQLRGALPCKDAVAW